MAYGEGIVQRVGKLTPIGILWSGFSPIIKPFTQNLVHPPECPAGISAQIMGHKPSALAEKHYRKRPIDLLRQWHTKIEKFILDEAGISQPEESSKHIRLINTK